MFLDKWRVYLSEIPLRLNDKAFKRNNEARSHNHCFSGKTVSITYSECVSKASVIQHAMRMRRVILTSVAFSLSHKRYDCWKKLLNIKYLF